MEELLNRRIEEWWKPFKIKSDNICLYCVSDKKIVINYYEFNSEWECDHEDKRCTERELTSKESWLIQWLMNKEKINQDELENVAMGWFNDESPIYSTPLWTDRLIMILSVEDSPMEVLVSLLK